MGRDFVQPTYAQASLLLIDACDRGVGGPDAIEGLANRHIAAIYVVIGDYIAVAGGRSREIGDVHRHRRGELRLLVLAGGNRRVDRGPVPLARWRKQNRREIADV